MGTYRGAAALCGTNHKTVRWIIEAAEAPGEVRGARAERARNYDAVAEVVAAGVARAAGRIRPSGGYLEARAAGYVGSARNFRRLVAETMSRWRRCHHWGRRPGVWAPGEVLVVGPPLAGHSLKGRGNEYLSRFAEASA